MIGMHFHHRWRTDEIGSTFPDGINNVIDQRFAVAQRSILIIFECRFAVTEHLCRRKALEPSLADVALMHFRQSPKSAVGENHDPYSTPALDLANNRAAATEDLVVRVRGQNEHFLARQGVHLQMRSNLCFQN